jgi:TolA-binding protein
MRTVALSILLAAGAALASGANAQESPAASSYAYVGESETPSSTPDFTPVSMWSDNASSSRYGIQYGVSALKAQDFMQAETIFANFLKYKQNNADANFYMGVAKMNLGKWDDAKQYLEIAVSRKPQHPDPKSRLGVTYAKLGDAAAANAQRADLVKMNDACKNACRLSRYIKGGIEMIDEALAQPSGPEPQGLG